MPISSVIGLLAALIGATATLLGAWAYIRTQHPPKGELFRAGLAVTLIMAAIFGLAVLISRATSIKINGQENIPIPGLPAPPGTTPAPVSTATPTPVPTPSASPTSTPTSTPTSVPSPVSSPPPTPTSISSPAPTSIPAPTPQPTKTGSGF
jgi:hypothetical protein